MSILFTIKYLVRKEYYKRNIFIKIVQYKKIYYVKTYANIFSNKNNKKNHIFFLFHTINIIKFEISHELIIFRNMSYYFI